MKLEKEIWKSVKISDNHEVSNYGRIRNKKTLKIRKTFESNVGYQIIRLTQKTGTVSVHRIVADAFIKNEKQKKQVNHINGIKSDNRAVNLEWVTQSENTKHAYEHKLCKPNHTNKGKFYGRSHGAMKIIGITKNGTKLEFDCIRLAADILGISETSISNCLNKRSKTAGKISWEYV